MNYSEMSNEELLIEYIKVAHEAFVAKTTSIDYHSRFIHSPSYNPDYEKIYKESDDKYSKTQSKLRILNDIILYRGIDIGDYKF